MKKFITAGLLTVAVIAINACSLQAKQKLDVEYLSSEATLKAGLPFSEAVRVGNMLYLSGQIGIDPATGKLAPGGIAAETKQTLENIKTTLARHGSSIENVVKCTVYIDDISKWQELNKVYVGYFQKQLPARSALGADGLALGAALEIECFAVIE